MAALARFVTRHKRLVIIGWVLFAFVMAGVGSGLSDKTQDDFASFLPDGVEAAEVQELLGDRFGNGETLNGLIVYHRDGGLTEQDQERIQQDAQAIEDEIPVVAPAVVPFSRTAPEGLVSPDGDTAYTVVTLPLEFIEASDWGQDTRKITDRSATGGLEVYVTGSLGFSADFGEVFESLDFLLLGATILLVLVLLGIIYRAPFIAVTPVIVVLLAAAVAQGFIYLYAEAGGTVSSNALSILVVLMFGVGTDYCLLLVSRYREELHLVEDKHEAMERALRRSGPALIASGCTVIAAMLVLLLAENGSTNGLGPIAAIGVASALLAGLTLLPAMLVGAGRKGFWPRAHTVAFDPDHELEQKPGVWRRFGDRVLQRPGLALGATLLLFGVFSLGLLTYKEDYSLGGAFKKDVDSVTGFEVLGQSFPAGTLDATTVIVRRDGGAATQADVAEARSRLEAIDGVANVSPQVQRSRDGQLAKFDFTFQEDPYSDAALARVATVRDRLDDLGPGVEALVGAGSALQSDFNEAAERDLRVVIPVALFVITIILAILLQALVAPLVLIASVMISFVGTLGLSLWFITEVIGDAGIDAGLPTFAFIFLVALGIDYTIFLMSRVREEARTHGTREGMLRALAATGPVITSAGIILAGTFSVLMTLPVTFAFNIGFMVAVGILLDTFVVRTVMVPAAVELLGDKVWWPSTAQGGGHALREHTDETLDAGVEPEPEPARA